MIEISKKNCKNVVMFLGNSVVCLVLTIPTTDKLYDINFNRPKTVEIIVLNLSQ